MTLKIINQSINRQHAVRSTHHLPLNKLHPEEFWVFPLGVSACFVASPYMNERRAMLSAAAAAARRNEIMEAGLYGIDGVERTWTTCSLSVTVGKNIWQ